MTSIHRSNARIMPVILSGGAGTRLWPVSTKECPKQFLPLLSDKTMFQMTLNRVADSKMFLPPLIIGSAAHAQLMERQMAEIYMHPAGIVLEPSARNTAPAVALAALEAGGKDTPILVMPSDHVIADVPAFLNSVQMALLAAEDGWMVTFGIQPTRPETGYGYIAMSDETVSGTSVSKTECFIEKPDRDRALQMLATGKHVWNAGIFLFRADAYLSAMERFAPQMLKYVKASFDGAARNSTFLMPDEEQFSRIKGESIDYAIMEKAQNVATIAVGCGWSDVGSWDALGEVEGYDECGNNFSGDVIAIDSNNCFVHAKGARVSLFGVRDLVVISKGAEVMIVPRGETQSVKKITDAIALSKNDSARV